MNNRRNTIFARITVYSIICSTAIYRGDHRILLDKSFIRLYNKIDTFVML